MLGERLPGPREQEAFAPVGAAQAGTRHRLTLRELVARGTAAPVVEAEAGSELLDGDSATSSGRVSTSLASAPHTRMVARER